MRHAYPLIWCLSEEARAQLLGQISDIKAVPDQVWSEWSGNSVVQPSSYLKFNLDNIDYGKFMRRAPSESRQ